MPQTCIPASKVNNDLVTRALNYHGQQLTSFFKETPVFHDLDLKNVDYHLYHQRSKELRMEDRGKRLLLHRFAYLNVIQISFSVNGRIIRGKNSPFILSSPLTCSRLRSLAERTYERI